MNLHSDQYILKGGTALLYYGLDRFSEDIDLDGRNANQIKGFIKSFCSAKEYLFNIKKDTPSVFRAMIDYGGSGKKLKVEVSFRNTDYFHSVENQGIRMYDLQKLLTLKINTLNARYKLRDLYDVCYVCQSVNYNLGEGAAKLLRTTLSDRFPLSGLDELVEEQGDAIIPDDLLPVLYNRLVNLYDALGILE